MGRSKRFQFKKYEYGYKHEGLPYYKVLLTQQIKEILNEICDKAIIIINIKITLKIT